MELKPVAAVLDALPPLSDAWRDLVAFAAALLPALRSARSRWRPCRPQLRDLTRGAAGAAAQAASQRAGAAPTPPTARRGLALTAEQASALAALRGRKPAPSCCFGSTGSGKTEVYLRAVARAAGARRRPRRRW